MTNSLTMKSWSPYVVGAGFGVRSPGTGVAACGQGQHDAMAGVRGMLCGALVYVIAGPALRIVTLLMRVLSKRVGQAHP